MLWRHRHLHALQFGEELELAKNRNFCTIAAYLFILKCIEQLHILLLCVEHTPIRHVWANVSLGKEQSTLSSG